jgi:hypothetical protein
MKKLQLVITLVIFSVISFGQSRDIAPSGGVQQKFLTTGNQKVLNSSIPTIIFNNGPLVNSPGTGIGGADESILQSASLGMNTLGFGFQTSVGNWMADDFVLTSSQEISQVIVYGYQTFSTTTSTMTDVYLQIYNGDPSSGGTLVWGDAVTDRMVSSEWTGIYRISDNSASNTNRPIMECTCDINTTLPPGTYWLAVQMNGSLASGPWCPSVTVTGQTTTGNAVQYASSVWGAANDSGTLTQQGMPFILIGPPPVPFNIYYLIGAFSLIGIGIVVKRRFF